MGTTDASDRQDRQGGTTSGDARDEGRVHDAGELLRVAGSLAAVRAEVAQLESLDDDAVRARLATLERYWHAELEEILPPSVVAELHRLTDWTREGAASGAEVRIGLAQLEGWLDGLISATGFVVAPGQQFVVPEQ